MTELDRLLELALRATPGPWFWTDEDGDFQMRCLSPGILVIDNTPGSGGPWGDEIDQANAAYIAAASPDRVKALIEEKRHSRYLEDEAHKEINRQATEIIDLWKRLKRAEEALRRISAVSDVGGHIAAAYFKPAGEGE